MKNLKSTGIKKNILLLVGMLLIVIALPIATQLVQKSQENRSQAAAKCKYYNGKPSACSSAGCSYETLTRSCSTKITKKNTPKTSPKKPSTTTKINGVCGRTKNSCSYGKFSEAADIEYYFKWKCLGINGGSTAPCSLAKGVVIYNNKKENGDCNKTIKSRCNSGKVVEVTDSDKYYLWDCFGINGGTTTNCRLAKPLDLSVEND